MFPTDGTMHRILSEGGEGGYLIDSLLETGMALPGKTTLATETALPTPASVVMQWRSEIDFAKSAGQNSCTLLRFPTD